MGGEGEEGEEKRKRGEDEGEEDVEIGRRRWREEVGMGRRKNTCILTFNKQPK